MYNIAMCMFQRTKDSQWEPGLLIDDGKVILDKDCKIPEHVWNYTTKASSLMIDVSLHFKALDDTIQHLADNTSIRKN